MKRKSILTILSFIIVSLIAVAAFLPSVIKNITIKNSKEWIGRKIDIEKVKFNYFTGTLKVIDFRLYENNDSTIFARFDTLIIDPEPYRLIWNEFVIEQLYLKGLHVNVILYDSVFNFNDLIAYHAANPSEQEKDSTFSTLLQFEFSNIELSSSSLILRDEEIDKQMEINNLDFFIPFIAWNQEDRSQAGLKFNFKNGGYLQSNINLDPNAGDFDAELILKDLDISGYTDFVKKYIDLGTFQGMTDLDLKIRGNINESHKSIISGFVNLREFNLKDHNLQPLFAIQDLMVKVGEIDPGSMRFLLDSIRLIEPYVYFEMYDSTNNIIEAMNRTLARVKEPIDSAQATDTLMDTSMPELYYAIQSLDINGGIVDLVDRRTGEPFKYYLSDLQMSVDSIESTASWINTYYQMILNKRGKLVAQLGLNPNDPMNLELDYTINDFMLSDLNIYSRHYMGFPILYGDMYYKGHTEIKNGELLSENKLIIHNVELGNKSSGLYDLPLKFALFLLKDKDGVINLDIPVRGDLKNPKINIGKIVWNTFKNLIIKAAAAPVKLLSGLIGADPKDIESVEYDFLDTAFTEKRVKQLDLLLQLEQEKKDLEIELVYFNDSELEKQELVITEAGNIFEQNQNKDFMQNKADFEMFVRDQTNSDSLDLLTACRLLVNEDKVDSLYDSFNQKRLSSLRDYLKMRNDSTEILVIAADPAAPKNIGSKPRFEAKYGMKEEYIEVP